MSIHKRKDVYKMNNRIKYSMIFGSSLVSFIFGFTNPIMLIYFTSRVDPSILAIANMLSLGLGALVNNSINSDKFMNIYIGNIFLI